MARIIPNENSYIAFANASGVASATLVPTAAEVTAAVNLTPFVMSLTASTQGNVIPTPSFDSLFETSAVGTSSSSFSGDFYRDDVADTAWTTLPRKTRGYFIISRFGGDGADNKPIAGDIVEVWPVIVTSRSMAGMSNNTVQTFTVTCAVTQEPNEAAVVTA
jgi:hypothetical protein